MAKTQLPQDDPFADTGTEDIGSTTGGIDAPIDWGAIDDSQTVPAEDDVLMEVTHAKPGTAKSGNPKISVRYKLLSGASEGKSVFDDWTFTQGSIGITKGKMRRHGLDPQQRASVAEVAAQLIGIRGRGDISIQPESTGNDGKTYPERNRVQFKRVETEEVDFG